MSASYPYLILEGSPRQRGVTYGTHAADKIKGNIALYRELFRVYASMEWEDAKNKAMLFEPAIQEYLPDAVEEMRGLAEGSGVSYHDILALNCRSELMFALPDGCTSMIIPPASSKDGRPYIAQNWDWLMPAEASTIILEIRQPPLPTILTICEAGFVGGKGVNGAGIGCGLNALSVGKGQIGVPLHILFRGIMNSMKISDSIQAVSKVTRAGSGNFVIGCAEGLVLFLEFTPDNFDVVMAEKTALAHANHYLSPLFVGRDTLKSTLPCTFPRLHRAKTLLDENQGGIDKQYVWDVLADHVNYPDSVCSHEDPLDPQWSRFCTIYGIFIDLAARGLWVAPGNPCRRQWQLYQLQPGA